MREIKFRTWSKQGKKTYPVQAWIDNKGLLQLKDCIVEQFTGLKDKNGKEIYEGDTVTYLNLGSHPVTFDDGCFSVEDLVPGCLGEISDQCEIIGNVHEVSERR